MFKLPLAHSFTHSRNIQSAYYVSGLVLNARVTMVLALVEFYSNWGKTDNKQTNKKPSGACSEEPKTERESVTVWVEGRSHVISN